MAIMRRTATMTPLGVAGIVRTRYDRAASERRRLSNLLFAVDGVLALTLAAFIVFAFVRSDQSGDLERTAAGIAALLEAGLLAFLVGRRREAVKEEERAFGELRQFCDDPHNRAAFDGHGVPDAPPRAGTTNKFWRWTAIVVAFLIGLAVLSESYAPAPGPQIVCEQHPLTGETRCFPVFGP